MKNHLIRYIAWLPALAVMVTIFFFSAETGTESSETSNHFTNVIVDLLLSEDATAAKRAEMTERVSFIVRKGAHFSIYAALGACACFAMQFQPVTPRVRYGVAFAVSALYAAADELHQRFVPERAGQLRDVLIDSAGAMFGLFVFWCVLALITKCCARESSR